MKNSLTALLFFVLSLLSFNSDARALERVQSPRSAAFVVATGKTPSVDKVRESIGIAGAVRGWQVMAEQSGQMTLRNNIRNKHVVVVNIFYDEKGIRVEYVSSENLNYRMRDGVSYIHPKYNFWVSTLMQDIVAKVTF